MKNFSTVQNHLRFYKRFRVVFRYDKHTQQERGQFLFNWGLIANVMKSKTWKLSFKKWKNPPIAHNNRCSIIRRVIHQQRGPRSRTSDQTVGKRLSWLQWKKETGFWGPRTSTIEIEAGYGRTGEWGKWDTLPIRLGICDQRRLRLLIGVRLAKSPAPEKHKWDDEGATGRGGIPAPFHENSTPISIFFSKTCMHTTYFKQFFGAKIHQHY